MLIIAKADLSYGRGIIISAWNCHHSLQYTVQLQLIDCPTTAATELPAIFAQLTPPYSSYICFSSHDNFRIIWNQVCDSCLLMLKINCLVLSWLPYSSFPIYRLPRAADLVYRHPPAAQFHIHTPSTFSHSYSSLALSVFGKTSSSKIKVGPCMRRSFWKILFAVWDEEGWVVACWKPIGCMVLVNPTRPKSSWVRHSYDRA